MSEKEFVKFWVEKFKREYEKNFPEDFLETEDVEIFNNGGKRLSLGTEFFGSFELIDTQGNTVLTLPSLDEAKYYIYASRKKPDSFPVPRKKEILFKTVKNVDKYLDDFLRLILENFSNEFPSSPNFNRIAAKIFLSLDLQRF